MKLTPMSMFLRDGGYGGHETLDVTYLVTDRCIGSEFNGFLHREFEIDADGYVAGNRPKEKEMAQGTQGTSVKLTWGYASPSLELMGFDANESKDNEGENEMSNLYNNKYENGLNIYEVGVYAKETEEFKLHYIKAESFDDAYAELVASNIHIAQHRKDYNVMIEKLFNRCIEVKDE